MKMTTEELEKILELHKKWLKDDPTGKRADFKEANLSGMDLYGVDLRGADFGQADLSGTNLSYADFQGADLSGANLCSANLKNADFRNAKLRNTNLKGVLLSQADLDGAYLPDTLYQIVGSGKYNRCTTYDIINDQVVCGCWDDKKGNHLTAFEKRIKDIYGPKGSNPNSFHYDEYMMAIKFFKMVRKYHIQETKE